MVLQSAPARRRIVMIGPFGLQPRMTMRVRAPNTRELALDAEEPQSSTRLSENGYVLAVRLR